MATPANTIIRETTQQYLDKLLSSGAGQAFGAAGTGGKAPHIIEQELLDATNKELRVENAMRRGTLGKDADANEKNQIPLLKHLDFTQVVDLLMRLHRVVRIAPSGKNTDRDYDLLAIYIDSGEDEGIYATSEDQIRQVARSYNRGLTINESKEIMTMLREEAPRVSRCEDRDLIAVENGVFDYRTKELKPFSPDTVFLAKTRVAYDATAKSPVIVNPEDGSVWEVEAWVRELSDDPEVVELLWEIMGAIVRPHVRWNKSAWFYSEQGNNGKGTLVELMRNLVGAASYASIPIDDFGKDFMLEPLTRASCILVDENNVGQYIDKAANLKAIITNDVISINRKNKVPIAYQFWGFMVQCLNEFPRIRDRSESFYRRQLFVPFSKCFTGAERRYIKDDYVARDDVLRYVLKRVLHMDYHVLSEPEATRLVLAEYKEFNDPVRAFWTEMEDRFSWDLLPFNFLFDLYKAWSAERNPSGKMLGYQEFMKNLLPVVSQSKVWYCADKTAKVRAQKKMAAPEPLIGEFQLVKWSNSTYSGKDPSRIGMFDRPAASYRGVQRYSAQPSAGTSNASGAHAPGGEDDPSA